MSQAPAARLTPMMAQYWDVKKAHREAIVLFRMGDFYETFHDDAKIASRVLGVALTTRDKNSDHPVPLAGVPFHSADAYIARLLRAGYKVAVCEQIEDPALARGLVKRAVTEVLTPGTALVPALLPEREAHYALCIAPAPAREGAAGFAFLDFSTGEFGLGECRADEILDTVARWAPGEVFLPRAALGDELEASLRRRFEGLPVSFLDDAAFTPRIATQALCTHFGVLALDGLGCADLPQGSAAAGALLDAGTRLKQTRLNAVTRLQVVRPGDALGLDDDTLSNLEIFRPLRGTDASTTLVHHLDACATAMGSRLLRAWLRAPCRDAAVAESRHAAVEFLARTPAALEALREAQAGVADLERLVGRIAADRATPRDLVALADTCERLPGLGATAAAGAAGAPLLAALHAALDPLADVAADIRATVVDDPPAHQRDGGVIRPGASPELDALLAGTREAREWIAGLQESERRASGIAKLKVGYNKVFGYYLEVPRGQADRVPPHYIGKQTLVGAQRFVTPELEEREQLVLRSEAERVRLETSLFGALRARVAAHAARIHATAQAVAALDVLAAFAWVARKHEYVRPRFVRETRIRIRDGRHPVVERLLDTAFVPNDLELDSASQQIVLLTGPNMGGKSTYLRQAALIVLLAYAGSFVPAREAEIGDVDRIFTRVGASDNLARGQSTFLVEMTETAKILNTATDRSLIVLDEVGRGTSTHDGMSLAWAVLEYLHGTGPARPLALFATHYHELTVLADSLPRLRNYCVEIREWQDAILFLHRIRPGRADKSYGIQVAQLAGLPRAVIERARAILAEHERMEAALGHTPARPVAPAAQLDLFAAADHAVAARLRALDLDRLDAAAALSVLRELRDST